MCPEEYKLSRLRFDRKVVGSSTLKMYLKEFDLLIVEKINLWSRQNTEVKLD